MANKTMHHAVIGADTFELIDEKGREEITALKEDLDESVSDLKSALSGANAFVFPSPSFVNNRTMAGISYTRIGYNTFHVVGTATGLTFDNLFETTSGILPNGNSLADCDYLFAKVSVNGSQISKDTVYVEMLKKDSSHPSYYGTINIKEDTVLPVASNGYTDVIFRVKVANGATVDGNIVVEITDRVDNYKTTLEKNIMSFKGELPINTDLNDVDETGIWLLSSNMGYVNSPFKSSSFGLLYSTAFNTGSVQVAVASSATDNATVWKRQCLNGTWTEWQTTIIDDYLVKTHSLGAGELGKLDLNEMLGNNVYLLSDSYTIVNKPVGMTVGFVAVFFTGNWHLQLAWQFNGNKMWKRHGNANGTSWENWQEIGGASVVNNYTNEYSFPEYSQTVNLTASPQITADTNNYLAPSGDSTDRTADILAMLTSNGVCRLGAGNYYINSLQMPDESSIIGSGSATQIILSGSSDGFAIKPGSYCTLSDFTLKGALSVPTFGENIGGRHGILWQGTYTENQKAPYLLRINNIYIANFTGGGITCYDTGYGTANGIEATNIFVKSCWAGLNISYWSEFHKFTNVRCWLCRIGCVNNGGNNVFVNCDFSGSLEIAMLMDNSTGQSPNNSHGSCVGCVFNHTSSNGSANAGIGIDILNCGAGFIFSGCQIFFSKIHLEDSPGIVFANCNFGYSNCDIEVSGGKGILFSGNIHQNKAPITISNGAEVHFVNCYNKTTGALIEP